MSHLFDSARKLGRFFTSSPPASALGKRKDECEDEAEDLASNGESATSEDLDVLDDTYVPRPSPKTSPIFNARTDSVTKSADAAVQRAREVMQQRSTVTAPHEQQIQDELELQYRQENQENSSNCKKGPQPPASQTKPTKFAPSTDWLTNPNTRARLLAAHGTTALLADLHEPAYACRDIEIRDGLWSLLDQIQALASAHFSFTFTNHTRLRPAIERLSKETVEIIRCVASGGPAGAHGWEDLFIDSSKRQALVCAIIGNVLVEQVFQHIFFGGTQDQINEIAKLQFEHRNADEFHRTQLHASKIRSFLSPSSTSTTLPQNFNTHTLRITSALLTHLTPLLSLSPTPPSQDPLPLLYKLTTHAALLATHICLTPHTVYRFSPVFKEPPETDLKRRATLSEETKRTRADKAVVHIVMFPGVTAYRRGGWGGQGREEEGVRVRKLIEGWVFYRGGGGGSTR